MDALEKKTKYLRNCSRMFPSENTVMSPIVSKKAAFVTFYRP